jgi:hypothetical protein
MSNAPQRAGKTMRQRFCFGNRIIRVPLNRSCRAPTHFR